MKALSTSIRAALLAGCTLLGAATGAQAGTLKLGMVTWVGYGPLFLARDLGYFEEQGLTVELEIIEDSSIYMAALASGSLQGVATTLDTYIQYRSEDACFKSVYALDDSHGGDGVLVREEVASFEDLKGQDVGLSVGGVSHFWFNLLLKKFGMTEADVSIVNMTADDAAAAFMAGRIPVAVTWEPHLTLAKSSGAGKVLINSTETPGAIVDVVVLGCDVLSSQAADVEALVNGLNKANEYLASNPTEAYAVMAGGVGGWLADPADFAASAGGVTFYGEDRNKQFFADAATGESGKLIDLATEIWGGFDRIKMDFSYDDVVDTTFLTD